MQQWTQNIQISYPCKCKKNTITVINKHTKNSHPTRVIWTTKE